jgi:hypothetical protein
MRRYMTPQLMQRYEEMVIVTVQIARLWKLSDQFDQYEGIETDLTISEH